MLKFLKIYGKEIIFIDTDSVTYKKEEIVDDILNHDIDEVNKGLREHGWNFEIWSDI